MDQKALTINSCATNIIFRTEHFSNMDSKDYENPESILNEHGFYDNVHIYETEFSENLGQNIMNTNWAPVSL